MTNDKKKDEKKPTTENTLPGLPPRIADDPEAIAAVRLLVSRGYAINDLFDIVWNVNLLEQNTLPGLPPR